jgi:hypothetical protein
MEDNETSYDDIPESPYETTDCVTCRWAQENNIEMVLLPIFETLSFYINQDDVDICLVVKQIVEVPELKYYFYSQIHGVEYAKAASILSKIKKKI